MPTLIDGLRRLLLGDKAADALQIYVDVLAARTLAAAANKSGGSKSLKDLASADPHIKQGLKPSPGYEPLLERMGFDQGAARAVARFAVREGERRSTEGKIRRQISKDIRFLAKAPSRKSAIVGCARRLYATWDKHRAIGDFIFEANVDDFDFMRVVKLVADGNEQEIGPLIQMAAKCAPGLPIRPGPRISAASAAHQFFLENRLGIFRGPFPGSDGQPRTAEYVDALTAATRIEFSNDDFDPRPAKRRVLNSLIQKKK